MGNRESIIIGVTDCGRKFENYTRWIEASGRSVRIIKLSASLSNHGEVDRCDGILLTGGGDIHPRFFGKPEEIRELDSDQIDECRDEFELRVVEQQAQRAETPLLGICRGLQVVNIFYDGDLVLDLEKIGKKNHRVIGRADNAAPSGLMRIEEYDRMHPVIVEPESQLRKYVGTSHGIVTSSHHQAVGRVGKGLRATAWSGDGVIEALELSENREGFFLLVQWHPERMEAGNSFSTGVRSGFLDAAMKFGLAH